MDDTDADANVDPTRRLELGCELLGLFESSLRNMTISKLAEIYGMTPSEVVDIMCEVMEAKIKSK